MQADPGGALPGGWASPDLDAAGNAPYRLLHWLRRDTIARFRASVADPERAQADALARVLDAARDTGFARRHGLDRVRTLEEYRAAVPIRPFRDFADDLRRVAAGETTALVRHPVLSLVKTSGTTGEPKLLPVTAPWAAEVAQAQFLWVAAMVREQVEVSRGMVLTSVGKAVEGRSAGGFAYGANTGRMAAAQPWLVRSRYAVPMSVFDIEDPELRHYVLLRIALPMDVRTWTTANPSTILALCRAMTRHRESLTADLYDGTIRRGPAAGLDPALRRSLWPWLWRKRKLPSDFRPLAFWKLAAVNCWKGGAAPFFLERLPEAMGGTVPIREAGISASEGYFAIPLSHTWTGGVAWTAGHLLELVGDDGQARSVTEVQTGREYRLVVSTTAGLYRYDLDDVVRVVGWYHRAPVLVFVGKGRDVLSVTGEKVTAEQVAEAVRQALVGPVVGFSVGVRMADQPAYVLCLEGAPTEGVASRFDAALRRLNPEYDGKRATDRLAPPEVLALPAGTYSKWRDERLRSGAADGQVKDPILLHGDELKAWAAPSPGRRC